MGSEINSVTHNQLGNKQTWLGLKMTECPAFITNKYCSPRHTDRHVWAGLWQKMCFLLRVVIRKFEKSCGEAPLPERGENAEWGSPHLPTEPGWLWGGLWGQGPLPGPVIAKIDFRISSVTLLDPENDRGPLCSSLCSRNATDLWFLFQMLLNAPNRKHLSPGKTGLWRLQCGLT